MRNLALENIEDDILQTLELQWLPIYLPHILSVCQIPLDELAQIGNKIYEETGENNYSKNRVSGNPDVWIFLKRLRSLPLDFLNIYTRLLAFETQYKPCRGTLIVSSEIEEKTDEKAHHCSLVDYGLLLETAAMPIWNASENIEKDLFECVEGRCLYKGFNCLKEDSRSSFHSKLPRVFFLSALRQRMHQF
ncbi:hypothetical protein NPIL_646541 [Nephila pilipes]|uniref:Uncharacterized protein n=1 Tax=Nephila pilipes TaxID=299642 RepID=A0A8X6US91_NEPPI|nr:hypothetical protein NPIL_646541 [Nephila pilipes]